MVNLGNTGNIPNNIKLLGPVKWPKNSPFAVCLTHDVDRVKKTFQYFYRLLKGDFTQIKSFFSKEEPYWQFQKIIDIENRNEVKSTFFFLNESIKLNIFSISSWKYSLGRYNFNSEKIKEIICQLDNGGWEIGLHGSLLSYNNISLLRKEKKTLEKIVGHNVSGVRQHYLNLEIPETWSIQEEVGFNYDASFGLKYDIGYKNDIHFPFMPLKNNFMVMPLPLMDGYLFDKSNSRDSAWKMAKNIIDEAEKKKAILVILWHQRVFYEKDFPEYSLLYEELIKECKRRNAWFATCNEAYEYLIRTQV